MRGLWKQRCIHLGVDKITLTGLRRKTHQNTSFWTLNGQYLTELEPNVENTIISCICSK